MAEEKGIERWNTDDAWYATGDGEYVLYEDHLAALGEAEKQWADLRVVHEASREDFRRLVRLAAENRVEEFEEKALEDWDEAHRDPVKEFASALNTALADQQRRRTAKDRTDTAEQGEEQ